MSTSMVSTTAITAKEAAALRRFEDVIQTANRWELERAKALREIRNRRLYRAQYPSFEQYVLKKWDISRPHAHRLVQWAEVIEAVSPRGDSHLSETACRPLYGLTPPQQRNAYRLHEKDGISIFQAAESIRSAIRAKKDQEAKRLVGSDSRVICGDVLDGLKQIETSTVGLMLTSPPYAEQRRDFYPSISASAYPQWTVDWMGALKPKLKPDASVLMVLRPHVRNGEVSDYVLRTRLALRDDGWIEADELVWHKPDAQPLGDPSRPRRSWESILWFSLTRKPYCDPKANGHLCERYGFRGKRSLGSSGDDHPLHTSKEREDEEGWARTSDVFRACGGERREEPIPHPAMMPLGLADQLIKTFSRPGDLVADVFAGAGTTLVSAVRLGRRCVGVEIVPRYAALVEQRLQAETQSTFEGRANSAI